MNATHLLSHYQSLHPTVVGGGPIPYICLTCVQPTPTAGPGECTGSTKRIIFPLAAATHCSMLSQCLQGSLSLPGYEEQLIGKQKHQRPHHHHSVSVESPSAWPTPGVGHDEGSSSQFSHSVDVSNKDTSASPQGREYGSAQGLSEEEEADPLRDAVAIASPEDGGEVSVVVDIPTPMGEGGGIRSHWGSPVRTRAWRKYKEFVELQDVHGVISNRRANFKAVPTCSVDLPTESPSKPTTVEEEEEPRVHCITNDMNDDADSVYSMSSSVVGLLHASVEEMDCEEAMEVIAGQTNLMVAQYLPVAIPSPPLSHEIGVTTSMKITADASVERLFLCWASNNIHHMPVFPFPNISLRALQMVAEYLTRIYVLDQNEEVDMELCRKKICAPEMLASDEEVNHVHTMDAYIEGLEVLLASSYLGV